MQIKDNNFSNFADHYIEKLADDLEEIYPNLEIEISEKILYVKKDENTYIINKHVASKELWLSSPVSGAHHFIYINEKWLDTKGQNYDLRKLLEEELS